MAFRQVDSRDARPPKLSWTLRKNSSTFRAMSASSKVVAAIVRVVEASRRRSVAVAWVAAAASAAMAFYVARHAGIDTDTSNLISPDKPWRRAAAEMERSFPQNRDLLAVVVDGRSPDQAEDAAGLLAAQLAKRSDLFGGVRDPEGIAFFRRNGLLFLPSDQVQGFADGLIRAQPMLGALAADPSPRGVFDALDLFSQGAIRGDVPASALDRTYDAVAKAVEASLDGRREPLSWQNLMSGRAAEPRELRRILLMQPVLSFGDVQPGRRAVQEVHDAARRLGLTPDNGVTVRVTGPVALNDDQLAALSDGAGLAAGLSLGLLFLWLLLAMRSFRTVTAIVLTLVSGLLACAAFATGFVGPFNPISIAFGPLFIGIAIDFGIQYSVRFAAEHHGGDPSALGDVFERTTKGVGVPLVIAGAATAVGFFSLVPTDYRGVSDLGLIAGVGMVIALVLNLTLLPALLSILRAPGFREAGGFGWAAPIDLFLVRRRAWVFGLCGALAVASAALLAGLRFDFDPVNLENPKAESVKTLFDLMRDPQTTPYTLDILAGSEAEAAALASRISKLPEVGMGLWLGSFVPEDQDAKLDVLLDARGLLEPTLSPARGRQPPSAAESLASAARCASDVGTLASRGGAAPG